MTVDRYTAKADELRALARAVTDADLKAEYLKLAQSWEELAQSTGRRERPAPPAEQ